jgi:hypothetical protein
MNMMINLSEVEIRFRGTTSTFTAEVELWRVRGISERFYPTKMAAEMAARRYFPKDDMETNYGRLSYVRFHQED